jgi:Ca2+-binding RTX toxin-like protein
VIVGRGGPDRISGLGGDDRICGDGGVDDLRGAAGNDRIFDRDTPYTGYNAILARGGPGADTINTDIGNIFGGAGDDRMIGLYVFGERGDDRLSGYTMVPGAGDDFLRGNHHISDALFTDSPRALRIDMRKRVVTGHGVDRFRNLYSLTGSQHDDRILGSRRRDIVDGAGGSDVLRLRDGNDGGTGGPGKDVVLPGPGDDGVSGGRGSDRMFGGPGNDHLSGDSLGDVVYGGEGDDDLLGDRGADLLIGGAGNDSIGDDFDLDDDRMLGGGGHDTFEGGPGADVLSGGSGLDIASYRWARRGVRVDLSEGSATGPTVGTDLLKGIEGTRGTIHSDQLIGDNGPNVLDGFATVYSGDRDEILGGDGDDLFLLDGLSDETIVGGGGSDWASVELDSEKSESRELSTTVDKYENLIGGPGSTELIGNDGPNFLLGGHGADALNGLGGEDVLIGGPQSDQCFSAEWVDGCESNDGGLPYFDQEVDPPAVCVLASIRSVRGFEEVRTLSEFCSRF